MSHLIPFNTLPWTEPGFGVRFKAYEHGGQRVRLVEFSHGFAEPDWCRKGHVGYVLDGTFANDYSGTLERYRKGDVIFIPQGEADRHKAVLGPGETVTLLLFEMVEL